MSGYVLDHHQEGEPERLALMSRLLDPMHRGHIERLGVGPGARTLEVGCGNGSVSAWLADILAGRIEPGGFDLVTARAVVHHVADAEAAAVNLVASARPGGALLLIEPDFLPVSAAEPDHRLHRSRRARAGRGAAVSRRGMPPGRLALTRW
jgi:2-polyprenyl-3-methyl-5-hydroxy-6-metoxy-1,4-benzoquinol methylase